MKARDIFGRSKELEQLAAYYRKKKPTFLAVYGRRRIGKSYLIEHFVKDKTYYKFVGLPPAQHMTDRDQKAAFRHALQSYGLPETHSDDWMDLFKLLALKVEGKQAIIFFDEISWMAKGDPTFLPKLKTVWDEYFKPHSQVMLIVCGSVSSWIEINMLSHTGFVGRIDHVMALRPLPINACNAFWGERTIAPYDKLKTLCVTGGVPLYLDAIDPSQPFEKNLQALCLTSGSLLLREFDVIFHDLFDKRAEIYKHIVLSLVHGPLEAKAISSKLNWSQSGVLTEYLHDLETAGFISRDFVWHFKTGKEGKNSRYRLSDNYVRFYLRCLEKHKTMIERHSQEKLPATMLTNLSGILGLQFENLILANREMILNALGLTISDVVYDNPYYQRHNATHPGCQIDYLIQTKFNTLFVCEIKFSQNSVQASVIQAVKEKITRLKVPVGFSCFPVLIHANGVDDSVINADYFAEIIDVAAHIDKAH